MIDALPREIYSMIYKLLYDQVLFELVSNTSNLRIMDYLVMCCYTEEAEWEQERQRRVRWERILEGQNTTNIHRRDNEWILIDVYM